MNIFLPRIAANTKRGEIYEFVAPSLKKGWLQKPGRILNIDILALHDLRTGDTEHHGLVALDSQLSLQQALHRLHHSNLNGQTVQARPYYQRSWYNDPRLHDMPPNGHFHEKRQGDRRRGQFLQVIKHVSDHFKTDITKPQSQPPHYGMACFSVPVEIEPLVVDHFAKLDTGSNHPGVSADSNPSLLPMQTRTDSACRHFQLYAETQAIASLLDQLRANYPDSGIRYWIASMTESGKI